MSTLLVLGGARSGKSRYAQARAEAAGAAPLFIATAQPFDAEMRARIARHIEDRGPAWQTREAPIELAATLRRDAAPERVLLVDCLTLWLSNVLLRGDPVEDAAHALVETVRGLPGTIILVSNEVGFGIVPETPLGRRFRDLQGRLNQDMAAVSNEVVLVVAGLPLWLKPAPTRRDATKE